MTEKQKSAPTENTIPLHGFTGDEVLLAARQLSKISARACNIDPDDNWKEYAEGWIADAQEMLDAITVSRRARA